MNTYQTEWDQEVNTLISQIDKRIANLQSSKETVETRLAKVANSDNPDVITLRTQLTNQSNRFTERINRRQAERDTMSARLYANLSTAETDAIAVIGASLDPIILKTLATNNLNIEEFYNRGIAGRYSLDDPDSLTPEDDVVICQALIQLMMEGK